MTTSAPDPVALAQALIRRPSVTPRDEGALEVLIGALEPLGFECRRLSFNGIENLYARFGRASPHLSFAGHTDVVPPGESSGWSRPPFSGEVSDGRLFGRGAVDMKGALAAFVAAAAEAVREGRVTGSLSMIVTGDEEGEAVDGTRRVVEALAAEGERIDHCLVGEPTSTARLGDMVKIGRRGSLNAHIVVTGTQGHVAYPDRAANPAPPLVAFLHELATTRLDEGWPGFQPSNLEITDIRIGNETSNVIPARAEARINIRFNPAHTGADLAAWLEARAREAETGFRGRIEVRSRVSGEAFLTEPGAFTSLVSRAVREVVGREPELSTTGGTSDARFLRALCPTVEFGLVGATMHKTDENAPLDDLRDLARIYSRLIELYFEAPPA